MQTHNQPLVTIVVPTLNRPFHLKLALESAVNQTYRNLEILVFDNASSVSMQSVVDSLADPRIRFHRHPLQVPVLDNHTGGFRTSQAKYVASLHDDDLWEPDYLERMVAPLEANDELAFSFCNQWIIDAEGRIDRAYTERYIRERGRDKLTEQAYFMFQKVALKNLAIQPASSAVIRRTAIDWPSIPAIVKNMWDVYVSYLLVASGKGAYFIPDKLARYRIWPQSDTGKGEDLSYKMHRAQNQIDCYGLILEQDSRHPALVPSVRGYIRYRYQHALTSMGIALLKADRVGEGRRYLRQSLRQGMWSGRTWAAVGIGLLPHPVHPLRTAVLNYLVKAR